MKSQTLMDLLLEPGGVSTLLQPIFEVIDGVPYLFALEALSHGPTNSALERADVLFEYVRRKGRADDVDRACVKAALAAAATLPGSPDIAINVHASTIERDASFSKFLIEACAQFGFELSRLIIEIVDQLRFRDEQAFLATLDALRSCDVRVALDDIGLGFSNHRMLIEIRPDIYKIDRYFIRDCTSRLNAQAAIESIVLLAGRLGGRVVAEGVETADDLATVTVYGIDLVQGYYFARPQPKESITYPITAAGECAQPNERRRASEAQENSAGR